MLYEIYFYHILMIGRVIWVSDTLVSAITFGYKILANADS